jgi:hypothetical protein
VIEPDAERVLEVKLTHLADGQGECFFGDLFYFGVIAEKTPTCLDEVFFVGPVKFLESGLVARQHPMHHLLFGQSQNPTSLVKMI